LDKTLCGLLYCDVGGVGVYNGIYGNLVITQSQRPHETKGPHLLLVVGLAILNFGFRMFFPTAMYKSIRICVLEWTYK